MSKEPIAVGTRVVVYTGGKRYTGTVDSINEDGVYIVQIPEEEAYSTAHRMQLRRLVKTPLKKIWLPKEGLHHEFIKVLSSAPFSSDEFIEFVEVRKKNKVPSTG